MVAQEFEMSTIGESWVNSLVFKSSKWKMEPLWVKDMPKKFGMKDAKPIRSLE